MAKRADTPVLTWERVQKAISEESLYVDQIPGTSILLVSSGRIRVTWIKNGKKKHARIRLCRTYLNPRWVRLPKEYPVKILELMEMNKVELAIKGIIKIGKDDFRLLTYQQLDDLYSLERQFGHIEPKYKEEENRLWEELVNLLLKRSLDPFETIPKDILERLEQIDAVTSHLAGREKAIKTRIRRLENTQRHIKGALTKLLEFVPSSKNEKNVEGTVKGLNNSLEWQIVLLKRLLKDEPFNNSARWSIYHVRNAKLWLEIGHFEDVTYYLGMAISHL
jgi:hypothetical protein